MAQTPSTQITCNADALSRAADAILARAGTLSKNAILNAMAAAIAGQGHDWGFIKNAPSGNFAQNGANIPTDQCNVQAEPAPAGVWVVQYDERDDWGRAAQTFASKAGAMAYLRKDKGWWHHPGHDDEVVLAALENAGEYMFSTESDDDDDMNPYSISLAYSLVAEDEVAEASNGVDIVEADDQAASDFLCETLVVDHVFHQRSQGLPDQTIFKDRYDFDRFVATLDSEDASNLFPYSARNSTIIAVFVPQVWINDYAVEADVLGPDDWTIEASELDPSRHDQDYLKDSLNAPQWVKDWTGPYEIEVSFSEPYS